MVRQRQTAKPSSIHSGQNPKLNLRCRVSAFRKALKTTINLDPADVNYLWGKRWETGLKYYPKNGIIKELARHAFRILRSAYLCCFKGQTLPKNVPIVFYLDSVNQHRSLSPICEKIPNGKLVADANLEADAYFPSWAARSVALFFIPVLCLRGWQKKFPRWTIFYGLADYLDVYGYYLVGLLWLTKLRPKILVLSNDHCSQPRALALAAKELGIRTVYVQHAYVSDDFPPLNFDYALLDGLDTLSKYQTRETTDCKVYLVGNTRRKQGPGMNRPKAPPTGRLPRIGIAINDMDAPKTVETIYTQLKQQFPGLQISLRPHPADKRTHLFQQMATQHGGDFSNPLDQTVWDFLKPLDFLVAGVSGILLDAAFMQVVPLQHYALAGQVDHFGYNKSGLVHVVRDAHEISQLYEKLSEVRKRISQKLTEYDVTYQSPFDGKANELAASVLDGIQDGRNSSPYFPEVESFGSVKYGRPHPLEHPISP